MANTPSKQRLKQYGYNYNNQQLQDYHHFSLSNILSDPFLLSTISIGSVCVYFIRAKQKKKKSSSTNHYYHYS